AAPHRDADGQHVVLQHDAEPSAAAHRPAFLRAGNRMGAGADELAVHARADDRDFRFRPDGRHHHRQSRDGGGEIPTPAVRGRHRPLHDRGPWQARIQFASGCRHRAVPPSRLQPGWQAGRRVSPPSVHAHAIDLKNRDGWRPPAPISRRTPREAGVSLSVGVSCKDNRVADVAPMKLPFATLDVFSEKRFAGNPLAVVFDADDLEAETMQAIACEFGYPETVFVLKPDSFTSTARVRIFTPYTELPFAGHPTVGTALVLALRGLGELGTIVLEEKIGVIHCTVSLDANENRGHARFLLPDLPRGAGSPAPTLAIAKALGLSVNDIGFDRFVPARWSVGNAF